MSIIMPMNSSSDNQKSITIRPYQDKDLSGVTALWREVFPDAPPWNPPEGDIERKLRVQPELFFVAVSEDQVVGTAMAGYEGHRGWVHYVAVGPEYRRQGVGAVLMHRVEQALIGIGCHKLNLQVLSANHAAVAFYEKLGYKIEDRVSMAKLLPDYPESGGR